MIALVHNIIPPYRVPLFNAINKQAVEDFAVVVTRLTHPKRRRWEVPSEDAKFPLYVLRTYGMELGTRAIDVSVGTRSVLDRLGPRAVVVAGWDVAACWGALRWCERHRVPAIAWVETSSASGRLRGRTTMRVRREFVGRCARVLVPGSEAEAFVRQLDGSARCIRMPNSVDVPALRTLPWPERGRRALFVGELSRRKGVDVVLDALDGLLTLFDGVTIAGNGPLQARVEAAAANDPRVVYVGYVQRDRLADLMSDASIVLVPSRKDPWPLTACEAIVAGRPAVLGPGVGSAPDLRRIAGDAAVCMGAADPSSLIQAARRADASSVPREARASFSPEASAAAFLDAVR